MFYEFALGHNTSEAAKNICFAKGEGTVGPRKVTRLFQKCCSGCKNLDDQTRSGRPKNVGFQRHGQCHIDKYSE